MQIQNIPMYKMLRQIIHGAFNTLKENKLKNLKTDMTNSFSLLVGYSN